MIMNNELKVGITREKTITVTKEMLASSKGSGAAEVFSTPDLLLLIEANCFQLAEEYLSEGQSTVGINADFSHMAATPLGMKVTTKCELIEIDRKKLVFKVEAFDEKEQVSKGIHERFIIDSEKFNNKAKLKKQS